MNLINCISLKLRNFIVSQISVPQGSNAFLTVHSYSQFPIGSPMGFHYIIYWGDSL